MERSTASFTQNGKKLYLSLEDGRLFFNIERSLEDDENLDIVTSTMVIGMIPLAIEGGAGAVGNKSLSLTVIGGMIVGIIAILFVTPAFYIFFQKVHEKLTPGEKEEETDNAEPVTVISE